MSAFGVLLFAVLALWTLWPLLTPAPQGKAKS